MRESRDHQTICIWYQGRNTSISMNFWYCCCCRRCSVNDNIFFILLFWLFLSIVHLRRNSNAQQCHGNFFFVTTNMREGLEKYGFISLTSFEFLISYRMNNFFYNIHASRSLTVFFRFFQPNTNSNHSNIQIDRKHLKTELLSFDIFLSVFQLSLNVFHFWLIFYGRILSINLIVSIFALL